MRSSATSASPRHDQTADGVVLAESVPSNDRFELQRAVPDGDLFGAHHRLLHLHFGSAGVEQRTTTSSPAAPTKLKASSLADRLRGREPSRRRRHPHGARPTCSRWRRTRSASGRARSSPSTRGRARSSRSGACRPTTRTCSSTHDFDAGRQAARSFCSPTRASRCWRAPTRSATSPARRSRSSPRPRASRAARSRRLRRLPVTHRATRRR